MPKRIKITPANLLEWTEIVDLDSLRPHPRNPNLGDEEKVQRSIVDHGLFRSIGVSRDGYVLFGNHTYAAAMAAEESGTILVHRLPLDHTDPQALEIMLADNAGRDGSRYNETEAGLLLREIDEAMGSIEATLWREDEADRLMKAALAAERSPEEALRADPDDLPVVPTDPVTRPKDVWVLGHHRLICADATQAASYEALMAGARADFVFTSPPYNVDVQYATHEDAPEDWPGYQSFLAAVLGNLQEYLADGRALAWNVGVSPRTYHMRQGVLLEEMGFAFHRMLVWDKLAMPFPLFEATTALRRVARHFQPNYRFEVVYVMSKGKLEEGPAVDFGDLLRSDVFGMNPSNATKDLPEGPAKTGSQRLARRAKKAHPAAFPVALPAAFMDHLADPGAIVLDPFSGAGSTIIACERRGRRGYGIELDPGYVDVACRRFQEQTGILPVLESTGEAVDFVNAAEAA